MKLNDGAVPMDQRLAAARALGDGSLNDSAVQTLLDGLEVGSEYLRDEIRTALKKLNAGDLLIGWATDERRPTLERIAALTGLRTVQPPNAQSLGPLLHDREPLIRSAAAEAFVVFGTASVEGELMKAVNDPVADVRYFAALALGQLKTPVAVAAIAKAFAAERDPLVQDALMQAARLQKNN